MISFPIVLGRFRVSKGQVTAFACAVLLLVCVFLLALSNTGSRAKGSGSLVIEQQVNERSENMKDQGSDHFDVEEVGAVAINPVGDKPQVILNGQVPMPAVPKNVLTEEETTTIREHAAHLVGKFDDAYKHVNYSRFLSLQEQVKRMATLLQEKSEQLKKWSGWGDRVSVAEYFLAKKRIVENVPFKWEISASGLAQLVKDREYFNQLREAVNKTREIALRYQPIYDLNPESCSCTQTSCSCCARVFVKRLLLDQRVCLNFTYTTQGMIRTKIYFSAQLAFDKDLATEDAGEICLSDSTHLLQICAQFLNLTLTVHTHSDHKTSWHGCVEFHVNVHDPTLLHPTSTTSTPLHKQVVAMVTTVPPPSDIVTIASYPVGCFLTSDDDKHDLKLGFGV